MSRNYFNEATGMIVVIKPDLSYTLVGNSPTSVTDEELWDLAEDILPAGWEPVLRAEPGTLQHNLANAYGGTAG